VRPAEIFFSHLILKHQQPPKTNKKTQRSNVDYDVKPFGLVNTLYMAFFCLFLGVVDASILDVRKKFQPDVPGPPRFYRENLMKAKYEGELFDVSVKTD
jgi:hypothetical protein